MSFAVAALAADGVTSIKDADCVKISYPNFYDDLLGLAKVKNSHRHWHGDGPSIDKQTGLCFLS